MKNKSHKVYSIVLSSVRSQSADNKFTAFIQDNKYGWWRYTLNFWLIYTPTTVTTKHIVDAIIDSYGDKDQFYVFEVDIKDVGGMYTPNEVEASGGTPFTFFPKLEKEGYKFPWERD